MRLLLDTHAYLWWEGDSPRLGDRARNAIADPANTVSVSVASLWEVAIKIRIGKLDADLGRLIDGIGENGFSLLDIRTEHVLETVRLPLHHRDPFDRLLVAVAHLDGITLVSDDRRLHAYPVDLLPCGDA